MSVQSSRLPNPLKIGTQKSTLMLATTSPTGRPSPGVKMPRIFERNTTDFHDLKDQFIVSLSRDEKAAGHTVTL